MGGGDSHHPGCPGHSQPGGGGEPPPGGPCRQPDAEDSCHTEQESTVRGQGSSTPFLFLSFLLLLSPLLLSSFLFSFPSLFISSPFLFLSSFFLLSSLILSFLPLFSFALFPSLLFSSPLSSYFPFLPSPLNLMLHVSSSSPCFSPPPAPICPSAGGSLHGPGPALGFLLVKASCSFHWSLALEGLPLTLVTATFAPLLISWTTLSGCPLCEAMSRCSERATTWASSCWLMEQSEEGCGQHRTTQGTKPGLLAWASALGFWPLLCSWLLARAPVLSPVLGSLSGLLAAARRKMERRCNSSNRKEKRGWNMVS